MCETIGSRKNSKFGALSDPGMTIMTSSDARAPQLAFPLRLRVANREMPMGRDCLRIRDICWHSTTGMFMEP